MGMTKYFVSNNGLYIGGFDGVKPPAHAISVPDAPNDARQTWDGNEWSPVPEDPQAQRRHRITYLLTISRSNWTTAQMRELISLLAQGIPQ